MIRQRRQRGEPGRARLAEGELADVEREEANDEEVARAWTARSWRLRSLGARRLRRAAAAVPANFWGVVPQATPTAEQFQRLKRGGVDSVRIPIVWSAVQPIAGRRRSTGRRRLRSSSDAAQPGIEVLPFVYRRAELGGAVGPGRPRSVRRRATLPVRTGAQRSAWTNFVKQAVARYGPNGSFWAENPAVPKRPIRTWQIWNEENFKYFVARPNPAEYGKLVKLSYAAIKSADPGAQVILGGLFARPKEATGNGKPPQAYFASDFLDQMYKTTPGIKSKFNGVALHPYTGSYQELTPEIEEVRDVLKANHDAGKGLWITELGWSSQPPAPTANSFAKGASGQATQLKGAFTLLSEQPGEMEDPARLLVLGRRPDRHLQLLRRLRPLRRTASSRSRPGSPTSSSPAAPPNPPTGLNGRHSPVRPVGGCVRSVGWPPMRNRPWNPTRWRRSARRSGAGSRPPSRGRRRPRRAAGRRSPAAPTR